MTWAKAQGVTEILALPGFSNSCRSFAPHYLRWYASS
jgi:hypothetical protein